jgi:hypothetical protein
MVDENRGLKRDAQIRDLNEVGIINFSTAYPSNTNHVTTQVYSAITGATHSYPDKIVITNLLSRRLSKQLKGGYKR